jgi:hypothetical protein
MPRKFPWEGRDVAEKNLFKVWEVTRRKDTLDVIGTALMFEDESRLVAEKYIEGCNASPSTRNSALLKTLEMSYPGQHYLLEKGYAYYDVAHALNVAKVALSQAEGRINQLERILIKEGIITK